MSDKIIGFGLADLHLGYRQFGLAERAEDIIAAFEDAIDTIIKADADFVALAGDVLNSIYPHPRSVKAFENGVKRLVKAGVKVYSIVGNHEAVTPAWQDFEGVTLLDGKIFSLADNLTISGMDSCAEDVLAEKVKKIPKVDIFVMHQLVKEFLEYQSAANLSVVDLNPDVKFYFFGDLHVNRIQEFKSADGKVFQVGYPGSIEVLAVNEARDKFMFKFTFTREEHAHGNDDWKLAVDNVPIQTRPIVECRVESDATFDIAVAMIRQAVDQMKADKSMVDRYQAKPLVFATFDPNYSAAIPRLRVAVQEICLLRPIPDKLDVGAVRFENQMDIVELRTVLATFVPAGSEEFALTAQFLERPAEKETLAQQLMDAVGAEKPAA